MANDRGENKLIESMLEGLLKQRFSQFSKKYGHESVVQTWAAVVRSGGIKAFLADREWNSHTKIIDALDCLDDYCDSVEPAIQRMIRGRRGKKREYVVKISKVGKNGEKAVLPLSKSMI
jgi:hypothetical protein